MQLLKKRSFGDYFSDTFEFFRINFKSLLLNFFKLQGVLLILILIAGYLYILDMSGQMSSLMAISTNPNYTPGEALPSMIPGFASFFTTSYIFMIILVSISTIITYNYIPIYMEIYRQKEGEITFRDILDKYKENAKHILTLSLILFLLAIPIYISVVVVTLISLITLIGWIFVLGFVFSYFSQIWFNVNYYQSGGFNNLGKTFELFKDNFFKMTGATVLLGFMFLLIYYISIIGISLFFSDPTSIESLQTDPSALYAGQMLIASLIIQIIGITVGPIIMILVHTQQGMMFYSRIDEINKISEHEDINSIGQSDMNTLIQD